MIITLTWKEIREHLPIWLTMVVMTCAVGAGLVRFVTSDNPLMAQTAAAITILCLAATYGVVCGAMMLAGEHESGTLTLLDVFLGRRGLLWLAKVAIGLVLAVSQALAVTLVLRLIKQATPGWGLGLIGLDDGMPDQIRLLRAARATDDLWYLLLPLVTVEAYAWGLLGSALTRRVLTAAACAAVASLPVWCLGIGSPAPAFLFFRLLAVVVALGISCLAFVNQDRETASGPVLTPADQPLRLPLADDQSEERKKFLEMSLKLDRIDKERKSAQEHQHSNAASEAATQFLVNAASTAAPAETMDGEPMALASAGTRLHDPPRPARSPGDALWWLTLKQAQGTWTFLAAACFVMGALLPSDWQLLWPVASLLLGIACGTATFAAEQRDLSYQFLTAQHLPMPAIWRFKMLFWFVTAIVAALLLVLCGRFFTGLSPGVRSPAGTFRQLMGPVLYSAVWLVYGFCTGQIIVWLCRKTILALLLTLLVSAGAMLTWLPSLLCRGTSGWQLWVPPLLMLAASRMLVRAWAGGRIKERKPFYALVGFGLAAVAWFGVTLGYRAWEVRDCGEPVDVKAFRQSLPSSKENLAAGKIRDAADIVLEGRGDYLRLLAEVERLPVGVIELPPSDGQTYLLRHLSSCLKMADRLCQLALQSEEPDQALEYLAQVLALSRNLRRKAPLDSYLAGVKIEKSASAGLEQWLTAASGKPALLRRALDKWNRHAAETPPLLDCLEAECIRAEGLLKIPTLWEFNQPGGGAAVNVPEPWLVRGIVQSLEIPWEAERKERLWRAVWAGLLRAGQTPCWQLPAYPPKLGTPRGQVRTILQGWQPATTGPDSSMTAEQLAGLLEASWVTDSRLFCPVARLQVAATRARFCIDADRLTLALALHQVEVGKPAAQLDELVPQYLPQLPVDPYSGQSFRYRIAMIGEAVGAENGEGVRPVRVGQGILWSTGPDRVDDGGSRDGSRLEDTDAGWSRGGFDLIRVVPQ